MKARALAAVALLSGACSSSYDPCFPPASLVQDFRILAVRADPPELIYDDAFQAPPVDISVLAVHPDAAFRPVAIELRACPPTTSGRCAGEPVAHGVSDQIQPPRASLAVSPALLRAALAADPLHGYGGVRVQVDVLATGPDGSQVSASKVVLYAPQGTIPNRGVTVTGMSVIDGLGQTTRIDPQGTVKLDVGDVVGLAPELPPGTAEEYDLVDLAGRPQHLRERISYAFFVTPHAQFGGIGRRVAGADVGDEPAPGDPPPPFGIVSLGGLSRASGRLWVVARDGRGGEGWAQFELAITDPRTCGFVNGTNVHCPSLEVGCQ